MQTVTPMQFKALILILDTLLVYIANVSVV